MSILCCGFFFVALIQFISSAHQTEFDIKYCNNGCSAYFNGCNDCTCNSNGTSTCGTNKCKKSSADYCIVCNSNKEWNDCGSYCTKTCNDPNPLCIQECVSKCECPPNYPIWDEITNRCIAESDCNDEEETVNFDELYCQQGCTSYFDGCNECHCNGNSTSSCSTNYQCEEYQDHYCLGCESNKEWTECGSPCVATCDNPNPLCIQECQSKCYCPTNTVWNGSSCVALEECTKEVCSCEPFSSSSIIYTRFAAFCASKNETNCYSSRCRWKCK